MASDNNTPHWFPFSWSKEAKPLLRPSPEHFVSRNIYEPSVLFDGKTYLMLFRGESRQEVPTACVGRLGIGFSKDGVSFQCRVEPALIPDSPYEAYGLAHPRLCLAGGVFVLTYSAFDGTRYRLCLATSTDLKHWFRHGPLFPEMEQDTTSGSILTQADENGKYYMLVGAGDLWLASSTDLLNWEMSAKPVIARKDCADFAAKTIDAGPSPFLTKDGIVAILNGTNKKGHISVFAALLDAKKPEKCLANLKTPCLTPEADWEKFGYLPNTVRATGLSLRGDNLHLYYSGGDRCIGMASSPVPKDLFPLSAEEATEMKAKSKTKSSKKKGKKKKSVCGVPV